MARCPRIHPTCARELAEVLGISASLPGSPGLPPASLALGWIPPGLSSPEGRGTGRSVRVMGRSVPHRAVQCTRSQSVCIHRGTAGDFGVKHGLREEKRRGLLNATECAGWTKTGRMRLPEFFCNVVWLSQREGTWSLEKRDAWTASPCFFFAAICLPRAPGNAVPTACPKKAAFCCLRFQAGTAPDAPRWQERGGETGQAGSAHANCAAPLTRLSMPGGQPGCGPHRRALAALEGGDGARIAGDAAKHPRLRTLTRARWQVRVLFALPYRSGSTVIP